MNELALNTLEKSPVQILDQLSSHDVKLCGRDLSILKLWLQGWNQRDIAGEIGISQQQVSNVLKKENIKQAAERAISVAIRYAPEMVLKTIGHTDNEKPEVSLKALDQYYEITGIKGSRTSIVVENMYIDAHTTTVSADLVQLLGQGMDTLTDEDVLDIT